MSKKIRTESVDYLFSAILKIKKNAIHFSRIFVRSMSCCHFHRDLRLPRC